MFCRKGKIGGKYFVGYFFDLIVLDLVFVNKCELSNILQLKLK